MKLFALFIAGLLLAGCATRVAGRPADARPVDLTKLDPKARAVTEAVLAELEKITKDDIICVYPPPPKKRWWQFWKKEPI